MLQPRARLVGGAIIFALQLALSAVAITNGTVFDDEVWSLTNIEQGGTVAGIWAFANADDVHPPLSYVLSGIPILLTGELWASRLVSAVANGAALGWFAYKAGRERTRTEFGLLVLLLGLAGTSVMWGTSLRWYCWFNPVFLVAFTALAYCKLSVRQTFAVLSIAAIVLFHLNYVALLVVPGLALVAWFRLRGRLDRRHWKSAILSGCLTVIVCLPQALILFDVHLANSQGQSGSLVMAVAQTGMQLTTGAAVFPAAPAAIAYLLVLVLSSVVMVARGRDTFVSLAPVVAVLALEVGLLVVTGLGQRARTSSFLFPLASLVAACAIASLPRRLGIVGSLAAAALKLTAAYNAAMHQDTTKRDYNRDYRAVIGQIEAWDAQCTGIIVLHHQQALKYLADRRSIANSSLLDYGDERVRLEPGQCVVIMTGYVPQFPREKIERLHANIIAAGLEANGEATFGHDRYAELKSRLAGRTISPELVRLTLYRYGGDRPFIFYYW